MMLLHRMNDASVHPADAEKRCPDLLAAWLRHAPSSRADAHADFEDWAEPAHVLASMERHGRVVLLGAGPEVHYDGDRTPLVPSNEGSPKAIMWGRFLATDSSHFPLDVDLTWNAASQVRRVQDYPTSPVFLSRVGRAFHVCDMTDRSVSRAMVELREAGHARGFVKTRDKGSTNEFDVPDRGERDLAMRLNLDDPYMFAMREGDRACLFVQQAIRPTREYRLFVVGDRVVTGAGCIVQYTPCDNEGSAFDERVEIVRYEGEFVRDAGVVARYVDFARDYAREWAAEYGSDMGYALDLCIDADSDTIQIIEMNPLANVGLYAIDTDLLVDAMVGHAPGETAA